MVEQVQASSVLYDGAGFNDGNNGLTFGVEFSPGVDIHVNMLGIFDGGMDGSGLEAAHEVGLWAESGQLLAQATAVPLPAAVWLFSAGLLVLSSSIRRPAAAGGRSSYNCSGPLFSRIKFLYSCSTPMTW